MTNLLRDVTVRINDAIIIEGRGGQTPLSLMNPRYLEIFNP